MSERIILAGGSGFLGTVLAKYFQSLRWDVVVLTRTPKAVGQASRLSGKRNESRNAPDDSVDSLDRRDACSATDGVREIAWDGVNLGSWAAELEGAEAVVNFCGKSVDCRYTAHNRRLLVESRTLPTRVLGEAIARCKVPPRVWLNLSTATIYKHTFGPAWDESGTIGGTPEAKDEFSIQIAEQWEREFDQAETPRTRKVALRSAMVLGHGRNSVFPVLQRLTRFGLGGRMGSGKQYVSWIHQDDFCRVVEWLIAREQVDGVINVAAPNPLTNAEMMGLFRQQLGMPIGLPATQWMLEAGAFFLRTETELIIKSRRVVPGRLLANGFEFRFTTFAAALRELLGAKGARVAAEDHEHSPVATQRHPRMS